MALSASMQVGSHTMFKMELLRKTVCKLQCRWWATADNEDGHHGLCCVECIRLARTLNSQSQTIHEKFKSAACYKRKWRRIVACTTRAHKFNCTQDSGSKWWSWRKKVSSRNAGDLFHHCPQGAQPQKGRQISSLQVSFCACFPIVWTPPFATYDPNRPTVYNSAYTEQPWEAFHMTLLGVHNLSGYMWPGLFSYN